MPLVRRPPLVHPQLAAVSGASVQFSPGLNMGAALEHSSVLATVTVGILTARPPQLSAASVRIQLIYSTADQRFSTRPDSTSTPRAHDWRNPLQILSVSRRAISAHMHTFISPLVQYINARN